MSNERFFLNEAFADQPPLTQTVHNLLRRHSDILVIAGDFAEVRDVEINGVVRTLDWSTFFVGLWPPCYDRDVIAAEVNDAVERLKGTYRPADISSKVKSALSGPDNNPLRNRVYFVDKTTGLKSRLRGVAEVRIYSDPEIATEVYASHLLRVNTGQPIGS